MSSVEVDATDRAAHRTDATPPASSCGSCPRVRWRYRSATARVLGTLLALVVLVGLPAHAEVTIHLQVATPVGVLPSPTTGDLTAHVRMAGQEHRIPLTRDDMGQWSGTIAGPPSRSLAVELWRNDGPTPERLYQGLEILPQGDTTLSWALSGPEPQAAWRLSEARLPQDIAQRAELGGVWTSLWLLASCLVVLVIGRRALRAPAPTPAQTTRMGGWTDALLWIVLGLLWTWPAAIAGGDGIVGRHFDALGTVWVIDAASRLGLDLHDPLSAWPIGADYSAIDSWVLLPLAHLTAGIDPVRVHAWLSIIGVSASGLAAAWFARVVGANRPWHHLAGILFAGSGLMAAGLLEGHVYQLINPWLPLMGIYLWRATSDTGRAGHGLLAGLFFGLALFSSGYMGICAALLAAGLAIPCLRQQRHWKSLGMAALSALVLGGIYLWLFQAAGSPGSAYTSAASLHIGSLTLESIGPPTLQIDRTGHSLSLAISGAAIALAVVGWRLGAPRAATLLGTAALGTLLAMGPQWATGIHPGNLVVSSPIAWLWQSDWAQYFRFPSRVMWTPLLCIGVVAAVGLTRVASRLGTRAGWALLALFLIETIAGVGTPFRQDTRPATAPDVYLGAQGPVLTLTGEGTNPNGEIDAWLTAMICQLQTRHHRAIADDCVAVEASANPRMALNRWLSSRLYAGDTDAVNRRLGQMGFTEVALHTDWLMPADSVRMQAALAQLAPEKPPRAAEGVVLFAVGQATDGPSVDGPAQRITGPTTLAGDPFAWRMRLYLMTELARAGAQYMVHIHDNEGVEHRVEISNGGPSPEDKIDDGVYTADWQGTVTAGQPVALTLYGIAGGQKTIRWAGTVVPVDLDQDQIHFRLTEDGSAQPMLRAADTLAPQTRHRRGQIMGLGWIGVFGLIGLWALRHRSRLGA